MADAPGRYLSFEAVADDYDQTRVIPGRAFERDRAHPGAGIHLERGGLFLDAGVGTGRFAAPLARAIPLRLIGVDIAPAMMERDCRRKTRPAACRWCRPICSGCPFRDSAFAGALLVHILHLIEHWPLVLREIRRVLVPHAGMLFLGVEQGGRSILVDFYYERARARRVLASSLGSGMAAALAYLRRVERDGGAGAQVSCWKRRSFPGNASCLSTRTLDALARRPIRRCGTFRMTRTRNCWRKRVLMPVRPFHRRSGRNAAVPALCCTKSVAVSLSPGNPYEL